MKDWFRWGRRSGVIQKQDLITGAAVGEQQRTVIFLKDSNGSRCIIEPRTRAFFSEHGKVKGRSYVVTIRRGIIGGHNQPLPVVPAPPRQTDGVLQVWRHARNSDAGIQKVAHIVQRWLDGRT